MTLRPDPETGTSCTQDRGCYDLTDTTCVDARLLALDEIDDDYIDVGPCGCWCHSEDQRESRYPATEET